MMQAVHIGEHSPKSSVIFLPVIDMSSSDPTFIYSTLIYVAEHAERHEQTPVITFDQPLIGVKQDDAESSGKTPCANSDLKGAESLYDELMAKTKGVEEVANDKVIAKIQAIRDAHI